MAEPIKKARKGAPKNTVNDSEATKTQPGKNGGTLKVGNEGNKGGLGRPPNEVRAMARENGYRFLGLIEKRLLKLEQLAAEGKELPWSQVKELADLNLKYGLGERTEHMFPGGMPFAAELSAIPEEELDDQLRDAESREAP